MNDLSKFLILAAVIVIHPWILAWFLEKRIIKLISGIRVSFDGQAEGAAAVDAEEEVPPGSPEFIPPQPKAPVFAITQIKEGQTVAEEEAEEEDEEE